MQKHQHKLKSVSRMKQGCLGKERDDKGQVSPIMQPKSHAKHLKKSEIKQLSTASESLLVYDISRPQGNK